MSINKDEFDNMPMPMRRSYAPQIIGFLKASGKAHTIEDIANALHIPLRSVSYAVNTRRWSEIDVRENPESKIKYYAYKPDDMEEAVAEQAEKDGEENEQKK